MRGTFSTPPATPPQECRPFLPRLLRPQEGEETIASFLRREARLNISHMKRIGKGRFGKIVSVRHHESADSGAYKKIAIKVIKKEKVADDYMENILPHEIDCWRQLEHPHLVRMLGHYEMPKYILLPMEYGKKGDLLAYVQKNGPVAEGQARDWLKMIIDAVGYMHSSKIAHRDLRLENCILFKRGIVKVADFTFAKKMDADQSKTFCGSKSYSSPEILMGHPYCPFKADVWSIGVIGFFMVTDTMPFPEKMRNSKIVENQKNRSYTYPATLSISLACRQTIDEMMTFDQQLRPTAADCLRLTFFVVDNVLIL